MAGSLGKIIFLLSRMSPVIRTCAGVVAVREADPWGLILNARIPGSVAGWWKALPNSSAARASGRAATIEPSCVRRCLRVKPRTIYVREGHPL